jgi:hypothetical protein
MGDEWTGIRGFSMNIKISIVKTTNFYYKVLVEFYFLIINLFVCFF